MSFEQVGDFTPRQKEVIENYENNKIGRNFFKDFAENNILEMNGKKFNLVDQNNTGIKLKASFGDKNMLFLPNGKSFILTIDEKGNLIEESDDNFENKKYFKLDGNKIIYTGEGVKSVDRKNKSVEEKIKEREEGNKDVNSSGNVEGDDGNGNNDDKSWDFENGTVEDLESDFDGGESNSSDSNDSFKEALGLNKKGGNNHEGEDNRGFDSNDPEYKEFLEKLLNLEGLDESIKNILESIFGGQSTGFEQYFKISSLFSKLFNLENSDEQIDLLYNFFKENENLSKEFDFSSSGLEEIYLRVKEYKKNSLEENLDKKELEKIFSELLEIKGLNKLQKSLLEQYFNQRNEEFLLKFFDSIKNNGMILSEVQGILEGYNDIGFLNGLYELINVINGKVENSLSLHYLLVLVNNDNVLLTSDLILDLLLKNTDKISNKEDLDKYNIILLKNVLKNRYKDVLASIDNIKIISKEEKENLKKQVTELKNYN